MVVRLVLKKLRNSRGLDSFSRTLYSLSQKEWSNARSLLQPQHAHVMLDMLTNKMPIFQGLMALKLIIQLCVDASHVPPSLHLSTPPILQQATWS